MLKNGSVHCKLHNQFREKKNTISLGALIERKSFLSKTKSGPVALRARHEALQNLEINGGDDDIVVEKPKRREALAASLTLQ